jgi:hypothetical protein
MRDAINNNPIAQVGLVAALLVAGVFLFMSMGSGGEAESEATPAVEEPIAVEPGLAPTAGASAAPVAGAPEVPARPLPPRVKTAFEANRTVVLMIVKPDGVDDALTTRAATTSAAGMDGVSLFVVPVDQIADYTAVTQAVELSQVPALVVIRPKNLDKGLPTASVIYGYQSPESVRQAVVDARYRGHVLAYHP